MNQFIHTIPQSDQQKEVIVLSPAAPMLSSWLLFIFSLFSMTFTYLTYRQSKDAPPQLAAVRPSKLNTQLQNRLHDALDNYFNEQELRALCFDLGVDYEDLPFSGQGNKARELVAVCARLGQLTLLQQEIGKLRPSLFTNIQPKKFANGVSQPTPEA